MKVNQVLVALLAVLAAQVSLPAHAALAEDLKNLIDRGQDLPNLLKGDPAAASEALPLPAFDQFFTGADEADGSTVSAADVAGRKFGLFDVVRYWHDVALTMHQRDYSRQDLHVGDNHPVQPGPCYTARALAMVHLAMYDALVGIVGGDDTYLKYPTLPYFPEADRVAAASGAVGWAANNVLGRLYSDDTDALAKKLEDFRTIIEGTFPDKRRVIGQGRRWGAQVARRIHRDRDRDGSGAREAFLDFKEFGSPTGPFDHLPDPTAVDPDGNPQTVYATHWGDVRPFGHVSAKDLPDFLPEPLELDYLKDYLEVKKLGEQNSKIRTKEQTNIGTFWAYDGALRIGVPPRLYAQNIDVVVDTLMGSGKVPKTGFQLARLYAMTHTAMADATITAWRDKYRFNFWRPIIGIRNANRDQVAGTSRFQDKNWRQLGAPLTNRGRPGINPNFPAYPSGHATIGTAAFATAKLVLKVDRRATFDFVSDEFNGKNMDGDGNVRPPMTRKLTIIQAIQENQRSRVFLGVHWDFDSTTGGELGGAIAQNIFKSFPRRFGHPHSEE